MPIQWFGAAVLLLAILTSCLGKEGKTWESNWPTWRGPSGNGVAHQGDPPIKWDSKTNIRWKVELPGRGNSSPIIWDNQVFVTTAVKTNRQATPEELPRVDPKFDHKTQAPQVYYRFLVQSYDRMTGKLLWEDVANEAIPHEGHHDTHCYAGGSPTTDGKNLYVSFGSFGTYCYNLQGKLQWKVSTGRLNTRLGWGEAVTPVLFRDCLLLNLDQEEGSRLLRLDAKTGKTRWKTDREEKSSWNTPLVVEYQGKVQVILNATNRVRSYDLEDGHEIWNCGPMTTNPIPSIVADQEFAYAMSGYKGSKGLAIPLASRGEIKGSQSLRWELDRGTPYVSSPVLIKGRLYFIQVMSGLLSVVDSRTGKALIDRQRLPTQANIYSSMVAVADRIYLCDLDGNTVVFKQELPCEILSVNHLDDSIGSSPAIVGKQLLIRGDRFLYCLEKR